MSGTLMRSFRLLLSRRPNPPSEEARPLGLTADQVEGLRRVVEGPGWQHWRLVVERLWEREAEALLRTDLEYDDFLRQQALVQMLRQIATVADDILAYERDRNARADDRERHERSRDPHTATRNSPWWQPLRTPGTDADAGVASRR